MKIGSSKYIQDIAPVLAHWFINDYDEEKNMEIQRAYYERFKAMDEGFKLTRMGFHSLHDSYILSKEKTDNQYILWLNDVATCDFAGALRNKKGLRINGEMVFPLGIAASDLSHLSLNKVNDRTGRLMPCRPGKLKEYLSEEIISWDENGVEIAFVLIGGRKRVPRTSVRRFSYDRALLLIACKHLHVEQQQDAAWEAYFGHEFDEYYNFFKDKRNNGEYVADYSQCCKLIDEFDIQ